MFLSRSLFQGENYHHNTAPRDRHAYDSQVAGRNLLLDCVAALCARRIDRRQSVGLDWLRFHPPDSVGKDRARMLGRELWFDVGFKIRNNHLLLLLSLALFVIAALDSM